MKEFGVFFRVPAITVLTVYCLCSAADAAPNVSKASFQTNASEPMSRTGLATYRNYLKSQADTLVGMTRVLAREIKDGNLQAAQSAYAPAHSYFARIAPLARLFVDLHQRMDARAEAHDGNLSDPDVAGFHRIEYALFAKRSIDGLSPYADQLTADARELRARIAQLDIAPGILFASAATLTKDMAAHALDGSYERYAKSDLWDLEAEIGGVREVMAVAQSELQVRDPDLLGRATTQFAKLDAVLEAYKDGCGFKSFDALGAQDKLTLKAPLTDLAESLSILSATLAMN